MAAVAPPGERSVRRRERRPWTRGHDGAAHRPDPGSAAGLRPNPRPVPGGAAGPPRPGAEGARTTAAARPTPGRRPGQDRQPSLLGQPGAPTKGPCGARSTASPAVPWRGCTGRWSSGVVVMRPRPLLKQVQPGRGERGWRNVPRTASVTSPAGAVHAADQVPGRTRTCATPGWAASFEPRQGTIGPRRDGATGSRRAPGAGSVRSRAVGSPSPRNSPDVGDEPLSASAASTTAPAV